MLFLRRKAFAGIVAIEKFRLRQAPAFKAHCKRTDLTSVVPFSIHIEPLAGSGYAYSDEDVRRIKDLGLDVIVACHLSRRLVGGILTAAPFGIIAVHYGDGTTGHGAPPGFWETYKKYDATSFSIQQERDNSEEDIVLQNGAILTKHFFLLNQASLYTKAYYYLRQLLNELASERALPGAKHVPARAKMITVFPSLTQQVVYLWRQLCAVLDKVLKRLLNWDQRWHVAFVKSDWENLRFDAAIPIKNPPRHFLADPFVITEEGRDFCFVEDYDYKAKTASIAAYELKAAGAERIGTAIAEPFHMSFPFMFRFEKKLYMCPETFENRDIRIYECISFPLQWKLAKILMSNVSAVDTMLFEHDGLWWLFTNIDPVRVVDTCSELFIFYADNPLTDRWTPHRLSPVIIDSARARNAGLLFDGSSIYRVGQRQGFDQYGQSFSINKIATLTKDSYIEIETRVVKPTYLKNIVGTHHLHSNSSVSAFDYASVDSISS